MRGEEKNSEPLATWVRNFVDKADDLLKVGLETTCPLFIKLLVPLVTTV